MPPVTYDDAVRELYQAPHPQFVAERKRLADELRAAGDRDGAAKLAKLSRPTVSAWVVNQLHWHARRELDEMLAIAKRLRDGDHGATAAHREAIAKLRQRAANMLADAGNAATEATLRRVTTNLTAIAAAGGFAPDPPGALAADRDAPGFDAVLDQPIAAARPSEQRRAEERARLRAERERLAAALRTSRGDLEAAERRVTSLARELAESEAAVVKQRSHVEALARTLADLRED